MARKKTIKQVKKEAMDKDILNGLCPICHNQLVDGQIAEVSRNEEIVKICKKHRLMLG